MWRRDSRTDRMTDTSPHITAVSFSSCTLRIKWAQKALFSRTDKKKKSSVTLCKMRKCVTKYIWACPCKGQLFVPGTNGLTVGSYCVKASAWLDESCSEWGSIFDYNTGEQISKTLINGWRQIKLHCFIMVFRRKRGTKTTKTLTATAKPWHQYLYRRLRILKLIIMEQPLYCWVCFIMIELTCCYVSCPFKTIFKGFAAGLCSSLIHADVGDFVMSLFFAKGSKIAEDCCFFSCHVNYPVVEGVQLLTSRLLSVHNEPVYKGYNCSTFGWARPQELQQRCRECDLGDRNTMARMICLSLQ